MTKVATAKNGKPYAVCNANHGGNFCVFPKNGQEKAVATVKGIEAGQRYEFGNVGLSNNNVLVYDDSTVVPAKA